MTILVDLPTIFWINHVFELYKKEDERRFSVYEQQLSVLFKEKRISEYINMNIPSYWTKIVLKYLKVIENMDSTIKIIRLDEHKGLLAIDLTCKKSKRLLVNNIIFRLKIKVNQMTHMRVINALGITNVSSSV